MNERQIGKVVSVDSFRVLIKLDDDLKSLHRSGYEDIYEVARINSYVVIPVGADRIVAIVTRVKSVEETELERDKGTIFLTEGARFLVATMVGTIENSEMYIQGVFNYPVLDNPVWYVTKQDLDKVFDQKPPDSPPDYDNDYYLPIGTSPAFPDYRVKINPDRFFGKHAAILGNTGSGKSCTVASIIQGLFRYHTKPDLKNAHFIIFDTNGEYQRALVPQRTNQEKFPEQLSKINTLHIERDGLRIPYWFMNYDDFEYLFMPSAATQSPILKRGISIAKSLKEAASKKTIPRPYLSQLQSILQECEENNWKIMNYIFEGLDAFTKEFTLLETEFDKSKIVELLKELYSCRNSLRKEGVYIKGIVSTAIVTKVLDGLRAQLESYHNSIVVQVSAEDRNIDLPIWFDFERLITECIGRAIDELGGSNSKFLEYVATLKLRLESHVHDERLATPLMFNDTKDFEKSLSRFLAFVLGDLFKVSDKGQTDVYSKHYYSKENIDPTRTSQVTIVNLSLLPYEVLENVTGLIGRLILEFVSRFSDSDRGKLPIVIVLEEAQNYIPEQDRGERVSISKRVFERIAREGRKYGISLLVASQRPSELSRTVLSQCNSFIIHRLQNPEDQKYVRQLVSSANEDILQQLPILPQQHAIVLGDAVRSPAQVRIATADPTPNSDNPKFVRRWLEDIPKEFPDYTGLAAAWEAGEKYRLVEKAAEKTSKQK